MVMKKKIWRPAIVLLPALILSGALNAAPNILLLIGDDMGVETLASYGVGENPPTTAALDELLLHLLAEELSQEEQAAYRSLSDQVLALHASGR